MLKIPHGIIDEIYQQGELEKPNEACGYLAGRNGEVVKRYPMTNVDHSPEHFSLDPKEQFSVVKDIRKSDLELLAVYHSHPETPARPSAEDIKLAYDPEILYVIASLLQGKKAIRAFQIIESQVKEVAIQEVTHGNL